MKRALSLYIPLSFLLYILVFLFIKPGYLEIFSPNHSDIFRYYAISDQIWFLDNWKSPRPLMLAYLHLIGSVQNWYVFIILLSLPSLLLVAFLGSFVSSRFEEKPSYFAAIMFFLLIYSSPLFIPMYQYDIGGMLSGIITIFLVKYILEFLEDSEIKNFKFILIFLLSFVALEFKQTFAVSLFVFGLILFFIYRTRKTFLVSILLGFSIFINLVKDKVFNSAFMRTDTSSDVYSILISPIKNLELLNFYILNSFTLSMSIALFISIVILYNKNKEILLIIIILAISASIPMSLLVNREWSIYSYYSMILFVSIIQLASIKISYLTNKYLKSLIFFTFTFLVLFHAYTPSTETTWNSEHQKYNKNVLQSLDNLNKHFIGKNFLFAGLQGPYHPFKSKKFIELYTDNNINKFDVLLYENEKPWNEMSKNDQPNGIYLKDLDLFSYDMLVVFDEKGSISGIYEKGKFGFIEESSLEKSIFLNCGLLYSKEDILLLNQIETLKVMKCLDSKLDFLNLLKIKDYKDLNLYNSNPWEFYYVAHSYYQLRSKIDAEIFIKKAINLESDNKIFLDLMKKIKNMEEIQ